MAEKLIDGACPVCGELPGMAGQQIGDRRYSAACVIYDEATQTLRLKSAQEHAPILREKATDAWHRQLNDGRIEVMCKAPNFRMRVTAPEEQAWEAVELFERWTGLTIGSDRRPRKRPVVPAGQLSMTELESGGSDG